MKSIKKYSWSLALTLGLIGLLACDTTTLPGDSAALTPTPTTNAAQADDATQGAIGRSTRQAKETESSQATATQAVVALIQTEEASHAGTATAEAQATSQAVLAVKASWPVALTDSFADNHLGWPLGVTQDHSLSVNSSIADGKYQWTTTVKNGNSYFNLIPTAGPVFSDFYAQVTVDFTQGNDDGKSAYGLAFRQVKDDYGFFGILKSGRFRALEVHDTGIYQSLEADSSAIKTGAGQSNRLAVMGLGSDFVLLINDQTVGLLHADIAPGQIGLGIDAGAKASEAQVEFSELEIHAPQ